jgi:dTDP-4-dehydrorhamnose reductase
MRILVLGAGGMLGSAMFRCLAENRDFEVFGTIRRENLRRFFCDYLACNLLVTEDLEDLDNLSNLFLLIKPSLVINCLAPGKSLLGNIEKSIAILSLLPQRLSYLCRSHGSRFITFSSDGVFAGARGGYTEDDVPDAIDCYGIAKLLGEVRAPNTITLRISIIGREFESKSGTLEWFLSQSDECRGFTRAIFSGFPTAVLAQLIRDVIVPRADLCGVLHLATDPISKFDLLALIARRLGKSIKLIPDDSVVIDRSLSAARFNSVTGYVPPSWPEMIDSMVSYNFGLAERYEV